MQGLSTVGCWPAAHGLRSFALGGGCARPPLPDGAVPLGRHGFVGEGCSPAPQAGNCAKLTLVPPDGEHGFSGVGDCPAAHGANEPRLICPFCVVGWHGFV
jgi:hypothetical protein